MIPMADLATKRKKTKVFKNNTEKEERCHYLHATTRIAKKKTERKRERVGFRHGKTSIRKRRGTGGLGEARGGCFPEG